MMRRFVETTTKELYLNAHTPVYINRVQESFTLSEHNHEFIEINYVSEGTGFQYIAGEVIAVTKGDLFYLPIGVSHIFRPATSDKDRQRLIVYNCLIEREFAAQLACYVDKSDQLQRYLLQPYPEQQWYQWRDSDGTLQSIFYSLYKEFTGKPKNYMYEIQAQIIRLLIHMERSLEKQRHSSAVQEHIASDQLMEELLRYIEQKLPEAATMATLAANIGLSERQLRRKFLNDVGMNYTEYIQLKRIEASCQLLKSTNKKVVEIARLSGYEDITYFNRLFKKIVGMSPNQFRK
ncbi:helix-turn-helix domain-containing protein [Paenibacillus yanchengensis]|uniref:Helix-turn-helix domain-containing protein n=1 Tax=Paenibacillus yanchengensis TaxID=2035833 RepID=A0ABW4YNT8_9BACL